LYKNRLCRTYVITEKLKAIHVRGGGGDGDDDDNKNSKETKNQKNKTSVVITCKTSQKRVL